MARDDKLLERMRRSKTGWSHDDLKKLYLSYGFLMRDGNKHSIFSHPVFPDLRATVARHNTLAIGYVQYAIKLIDKLNQYGG